jgi:hypothetical protein
MSAVLRIARAMARGLDCLSVRLRLETGFVGLYLFLTIGLAFICAYAVDPALTDQIKVRIAQTQSNSGLPTDPSEYGPAAVMHQVLDPVTSYEDQMRANIHNPNSPRR